MSERLTIIGAGLLLATGLDCVGPVQGLLLGLPGVALVVGGMWGLLRNEVVR